MQTEESKGIARAPQKPGEDGKYILLHEKHSLHNSLHKLHNIREAVDLPIFSTIWSER